MELFWGAHRVVVVEVGGGLRSYRYDGEDVLDGYSVDEVAPAARGQLLIPWPNRLHGGRYTWDGQEHVVPMDEPDQQNALHGLARWSSWTAEQPSPRGVSMKLVLRPQPAYPFTLALETAYQLGEQGLTVTMRATNIGDSDAPYGCGAHPYLTAGTERIDDALLQVPARSWLPTGPAQIPLGVESVEGTAYDFREQRPVGRVHLDHAFTDLDRDAEGRATVRLAAPGGRQVELWVDEQFTYLEVFTGDPLPDGRRRRSLGLEPMTCPPNAFVTGEVRRLRPGDTTTATWGIRVG
ncbi:MAG: aldose 1-epimerase [Nocardioidaceae bacterium]|nr:aldose 1-epimerase [Nocardioidaceae bacterium]